VLINVLIRSISEH